MRLRILACAIALRLVIADVGSISASQFDTGCQAVSGTITAQIVPGGAIGTIQGDIEGSIITVQQPDPVGNTDEFLTGSTFHLIARQTVHVTGGTFPELVGQTIVWTAETRAVDLPPIRRVSNTLTVVEGADGHLVSHGILDLTTRTTDFAYQGVICL
jgi:hypothetical protein